jgi:DnaK suppressor protein
MLDQALLDKIQKNLQDQKIESQNRIKELESSDPFNLETQKSVTFDRSSPDDEAQINEMHERISAQILTLRNQIVRIDSAVERIGNGTYGTCEVCGQPIESTRLSIMPLASLCLKDEKTVEKRVKKA